MGLFEAVGGAVNKVKSAVSNAAGSVKSAVTHAAGSVKGAASNAAGAVKSTAGKAAGSVSSAAKSAGSTAAKANMQVKSAAGNALGAGKTLTNSMSGITSKTSALSNFSDWAKKGAGADKIGEFTEGLSKNAAGADKIGDAAQEFSKKVGVDKIGEVTKNLAKNAAGADKIDDIAKSISSTVAGADTQAVAKKSVIPLHISKVLPDLLSPHTGPLEKIAAGAGMTTQTGNALAEKAGILGKVSRAAGPVGAVLGAVTSLANPTSTIKDKLNSVGGSLYQTYGFLDSKGSSAIKAAEKSSELLTRNPISQGALKISEDSGKILVKDSKAISNMAEHAGDIAKTSRAGELLKGAGRVAGGAGVAISAVCCGLETKEAYDANQRGDKKEAQEKSLDAIGDGMIAGGSACMVTGVGAAPGAVIAGVGGVIRYRHEIQGGLEWVGETTGITKAA